MLNKSLTAILFIKRAFFFLKTFGVEGTLKAVKNYFETLPGKMTASEYYFITDFDEKKKFEEKKVSSKQLQINWIIPDIGIGGGGHRSIFRFVDGLEKSGHTNTIYIMTPNTRSRWGTAENARRIITNYYLNLNAEVFEGTNNMKESDVCIATSWQTAYPLYKIQNTKKKIYFVQDYECDFYPKSSAYLFAEQTYKMGYKCITGGKWLAKLLKEKYDLQCGYFEQAHDSHIYKIDKNIKRSPNTVVFYGRPLARRGFELGIFALEEVAKMRKDVKVVFFGGDRNHPNFHTSFQYKNVGILSEIELAKLFNCSTVGVVFSLTNYSLVTQEMMACGLPVIDIKGECTQDIYPRDTITLANPEPKSIADTILFLLNNEEKRKRLQKNALDYIKDLQWEKEIKKVEDLIFNL